MPTNSMTGERDPVTLSSNQATDEAQLNVSGASGLITAGMAKVVYDFAVDGGAVGLITPATSVALPPKAIIERGFMQVVTALTSGGAATLAVGLEGTTDLLAATAFNNAALAQGLKDLVPVGTVATMFQTTVARKLTVTVATAALTAGKIIFFLRYHVGL